MVLSTQIGSPPRAGPELGTGHGVLRAIVRIEANDATVPDIRA
jgi:hypothetical protein